MYRETTQLFYFQITNDIILGKKRLSSRNYLDFDRFTRVCMVNIYA